MHEVKLKVLMYFTGYTYYSGLRERVFIDTQIIIKKMNSKYLYDFSSKSYKRNSQNSLQ